MDQVGRFGRFVQQRRDGGRQFTAQRHLHKNQGLVGQVGMKKPITTAVGVEAVLHVCPTLDVVHGFVFDELFNQRRRRIPADTAQIQKTHIKPGRKHVFHFDIQRQQPFVGFQMGQQLCPNVYQKPDAATVSAEALQQASAWRHSSAAESHLGSRFFRRASCAGQARLSQLQGTRICHKLLAHQQPQIVLLCCWGIAIPTRQFQRPAPAFDFADVRINDGP